MMPKPYDRLQVQGHTLDWLTYAAFLTAQARPDGDNDWSILQGSYNAGGVGASAGTHDGGGAIDVSPFNWQQRVHAMRAVGWAAWHRPELFDANGNRVWGEHIHAVLPGNKKMASLAKLQAQEYPHHRDGLGAFPFGPDNTWHPDPIPVFDFAKWRKENTLLDSDKTWLQQRFDNLNANVDQIQQAVAALRQGSADRDAALRTAVDALPDNEPLTKKQTRELIEKALADTTGGNP